MHISNINRRVKEEVARKIELCESEIERVEELMRCSRVTFAQIQHRNTMLIKLEQLKERFRGYKKKEYVFEIGIGRLKNK